MKNKPIKIITTLLIAALLAFSIAACSKKPGPTPEPTPEVPATYTVTFDAGGGTLNGANTKTLKNGDVLGELPEVIAPDGYKLGGWYDDGGKEWTKDSKFDRTENVTLKAEYLAVPYVIEYELNGGAFTSDDLSEVGAYTTDAALTLPGADKIEKTGYKFVGWYDNAELGGEAVAEIPAGSVGNKRFYAKYATIVYTIAFDLNDEAGSTRASGDTTEIAVDYVETTVDLPPVARKGYDFLGWAYDENASVADFTYDNLENVGNMSGATDGGKVTLHAVWSAKAYSVAFTANANAGIAGNDKKFNDADAKTGYTPVKIDAKALLNAGESAIFDTDFTFSAPTEAGYAFTVAATMDGESVDLAAADGKYTISGADIDGNIVINVEKHVAGIEIAAEKASYEYVDGGAFKNYAESAPNGNRVKYEGYRAANGDAYFRVTVVSGKIDNIGNHSNSDGVRLVLRKTDGSAVTDVYLSAGGVYFAGLPVNPWTADAGIIANMKSVTYSESVGDKIVSHYEIMIPAEQTSAYGAANDDIYFTMTFVTRTGETLVFPGKANVNPQYWAKFGGNLVANKMGYSTLLTADGVYDYDAQAKRDAGISIDGVLDEEKWKTTGGLTFSESYGSAVYKGFVTDEGIYYAAYLKHADVGVQSPVAVLAMFFGTNGWTDGFRVREELNMVGNGDGDSYGTACVTIDRGETCVSVIEAFVPFRELKAKHGVSPVGSGDDLAIEAFAFYQNNKINGNAQWKVGGYGSLQARNFKFTKTGLRFNGNGDYEHSPVSFDACGGSVAADEYVQPLTAGATLGALPVATKAGYVFDGWYDSADGGEKIESTRVLAKNEVFGLTLYARYSHATYAVTGKDGAALPSSVADEYEISGLGTTATHGTDFAFTAKKSGAAATDDTRLLRVAIRIGGVEYNATADGDTYTIDGNDILGNIEISVGLIDRVSYTVEFDGGEGASGSTASVTAYVGVPFTLTTSDFTKPHYVFKGWASEAGGAVVYADGARITDDLLAESGTVTLYAVWEAETYRVTHVGIGLSKFTSGGVDKYSRAFVSGAEAGENKATYGVDYSFTVAGEENYFFEVTATIGDKTYAFDGSDGNFASASGNAYVIPGSFVTADVTISVVKHAFNPNVLTGKSSVTYTDSTGNGNAMKFTAVKGDDGLYIRAEITTNKARINSPATGNDAAHWIDAIEVIIGGKDGAKNTMFGLGLDGTFMLNNLFGNIGFSGTALSTKDGNMPRFTVAWTSSGTPTAAIGNSDITNGVTTEVYEFFVGYSTIGYTAEDTEIPMAIGHFSKLGAEMTFDGKYAASDRLATSWIDTGLALSATKNGLTRNAA